MEASLRQAVEIIHKSPTLAVLYVAGGASHAASWLFSVPGASSTILETRVPYDRAAFIDTVGAEAASKLSSFASEASARALAKAAYRRAVALAPAGARVCGIAAACALVTTHVKKGDHCAYIAAHTHDRVVEYQIKLLKGHRSRWEEEVLSSRLLLQALFDDCGGSAHFAGQALMLSQQSSMHLVREKLTAGDRLSGPNVHEHPDPIEAILQGDAQFCEHTKGRFNIDATKASLILPGSFNPLHYGHRQLMSEVQSRYPNDIAAYEISATNPDKPPLAPDVIRSRMKQFADNEIVIVSSAPLFARKAVLYPNTKFVVGADTAERIVASKYYGGEEGMVAALVDMKCRGCKFLVAGRLEQTKNSEASRRFETLRDIQIPLGLRDLFEEIPDSSFRVDISSSEIRSRNK